jgi:hypothetical protein
MSTHQPGSPVAPEHQGLSPTYVLRNLPGIAEIEALLVAAERHPNPNWAPERERAQARIEPTSRRLFGITADDTAYVDEPALDEFENARLYEDWEDLLGKMAYAERDEIAGAWREIRWDVWDATGRPLLCLEYFVRQIITVTMGQGGHLPGVRVELNEQQEQDLEARLRAEVEQHRRTAKPGTATAARSAGPPGRAAMRAAATSKPVAAKVGSVEVVRLKPRSTRCP